MLELKNVSGGYGKHTVVSDVSLCFPEGGITSVIGKNGCGKSTLLMLCAGLAAASSGKVLLNGEDLSEISGNKAAKHISYLSQIKSAGSITVRSLVAHGRFPYLGYPRRYTKKDNEKINEAMRLAGVDEIADRNVNELSGGQQQRVYIAMTLAQDTQIILLDEPLTFLDINRQLELMELIVKLKALGKTVIMVIHDLNLALRYSDKVVVMEHGTVTAFDTPRNIIKSNAIEAAFGVKAEYCPEIKQYFFEKSY
ncbi:MAG: ABC transporter ATP-binding protein [Oscillospiraceae bacterium]